MDISKETKNNIAQKKFEMEIERIKRFGIKEEVFEEVERGELILTQFDTNYLLAHIDYLTAKNEELTDGLERIATGMLTKGESEEQAKYSLEKANIN